ncbi:MAG TPA: helix-turn-helix transcriptional regulator [Acidimicrobiia bacterium]|nr:helix-turn-helix transcriptional regulator [Acidimicrobiia bacterium]
MEENPHMSALFTPNQLVAYHLARIRKQQGLTQEQTVELLTPFLGVRWSVASLSAAERSIDGKRVKEFNADELVALSRAFDVPLAFWFTPPPPNEQPRLATPDASDEGLPVDTLLDIVFGRTDNRHSLEQGLLAGRPEPEVGSVAARLDADTALRLRRQVRDAFGELDQARQVLEQVASMLGQLDNPDQNLSSSTGTHDNQTE